MERDQPEAEPAEAARERASEPGPDHTGLCGWSGDVDCVREPFQSATGAAEFATKGNGDAGSVGRGAFPFAAANAYGECGALLLRRGARPHSGSDRHTRDSSSGCIQYSSARERAARWRRAWLHA